MNLQSDFVSKLKWQTDLKQNTIRNPTDTIPIELV